MPKVTFVKEKQEVEVEQGGNLRREALKSGLQVYAGLSKYLNCFGNGTCGTCLVHVKKGMENLSPKTAVEKLRLATMLATIGHEHEARLACQCRVLGDCSVETTPGFNWDGENFWQKPYPNK